MLQLIWSVREGASFVLWVSLMTTAFAPSFALSSQMKPVKMIEPHAAPSFSIKRSVVMVMYLENQNKTTLKDHVITVRIPLSKTSFQTLEKIEIRPKFPISEICTTKEAAWIKFHTLSIKPFERKGIRLYFTLSINKLPLDLCEHDLNTYLGAESYMDTNDAHLRTLGRQLKRHNVYHSAFATYRWVRDNVAYSGYKQKVTGASATLKARKGDCTELACLFAALCRINNIPSRVMGGYLCDECARLTSAFYHNWAEFYYEGAWHIADPAKRVFDRDGSSYIAFEVCSSRIANPVGLFKRYKFENEPKNLKIIWE